jgi:hypothetical protein
MARLVRPEGLAVGERVRFDGQVRLVLAVSGRSVTLSDMGGTPRAVPPTLLFSDDDFDVVDSSGRMPLPPVSLLETLPQAALEKALWWEGQILEVLNGLPPDAPAGTEPKPQYAPSRSLTARERAKAAELTAAGHRVSASTVANYRRRYEKGGVMGLADHRPVRKTAKYGMVGQGGCCDAPGDQRGHRRRFHPHRHLPALANRTDPQDERGRPGGAALAPHALPAAGQAHHRHAHHRFDGRGVVSHAGSRLLADPVSKDFATTVLSTSLVPSPMHIRGASR